MADNTCKISTLLLTLWRTHLNLSAIGHPVAHTPLEATVHANPQLNPNTNPAASPPD